MMGRNESQLKVLDRRFLCALKVADAASTDDPSTPPPVDTSDFEHIASDIRRVDYAQELVLLPNITKLAPNKLEYIEDNVVCMDHTDA